MWKLFLWPAVLVAYTVWEQNKFRNYLSAPIDGLDYMGFGLAMTGFWLWDIIFKVSLGLYALCVIGWIVYTRQKKLPYTYVHALLLGPLSLITSFVACTVYLFIRNN